MRYLHFKGQPSLACHNMGPCAGIFKCKFHDYSSVGRLTHQETTTTEKVVRWLQVPRRGRRQSRYRVGSSYWPKEASQNLGQGFCCGPCGKGKQNGEGRPGTSCLESPHTGLQVLLLCLVLGHGVTAAGECVSGRSCCLSVFGIG